MNAAVFGNGESRKSVDITLLKNTHTLIGCNAIHRDTVVDHLVCCDRRMVEESTANPLTANTQIHVRDDWFKYFRKIKKDKRIHVVPDLPYVGNDKRDQPINWGSGGYAVLLAATLGFKDIAVIGFDLYPKGHKVNNVYKGTSNYAKEDARAVDYSYWVYQISKVFGSYPDTTFTIVNETGWELPTSWQRPNVRFVSINDFVVDL